MEAGCCCKDLTANASRCNVEQFLLQTDSPLASPAFTVLFLVLLVSPQVKTRGAPTPTAESPTRTATRSVPPLTRPHPGKIRKTSTGRATQFQGLLPLSSAPRTEEFALVPDLRSAAEDVQSLHSTWCSDLGEIQLSVIAARVDVSHLVLMSAFYQPQDL